MNRGKDGKVVKRVLFVNAFEEQDLEDLKEQVFRLLGKIIVYTKKPGGKPDFNAPLGLPVNSTVRQAAKHLHKDFVRKLRFAKVWGSAKFPGQRVSKDYELKNKDIVEISA